MVKIKKPTQIKATYKIITPMFIGDAQQNATEISPQSFKGALRFWWRALAWFKIHKELSDKVNSFKQLHEQESIIFGSSGDSEGIGLVSIRVINQGMNILTKTELRNRYDSHDKFTSYALGQGLLKRIGGNKATGQSAYSEYIRNALAPNNQFDVVLTLKNEIKVAQIQELKTALFCLGTLGGLGSKNRRGLGSIVLKQLTDFKLPANIEELKEKLNDIKLGNIGSTDNAVILCKKSNNNAWSALGMASRDMQIFRGWGFKGQYSSKYMINKEVAKHNIYPQKIADHNSVYDFYNDIAKAELPSSLVFGLPRLYGLSNCKLNNGNKIRKEFLFELKGANRSRRASPVLIHIHELTNGETVVLQTIFEGFIFLDNDHIKVSEKKRNGKFVEIKSLSLKNYKSDIFIHYKNHLKKNHWVEV